MPKTPLTTPVLHWREIIKQIYFGICVEECGTTSYAKMQNEVDARAEANTEVMRKIAMVGGSDASKRAGRSDYAIDNTHARNRL